MRFPACDNWKPLKQQRGSGARSQVAAFKPPKPPKSSQSKIAAAAAGLLAGALLIELLNFDPVFAALMVGAVVLLLVSMDTYRAWMLLMAASLLAGYRFGVGSFTIRPEHVVLLALVSGWSLSLLGGRTKSHRIPLLIPLAAYLAVNLTTATVFSLDKRGSYQTIMLIAIAISMYVMTVTVLQEYPEKLKGALKFFLFAGAAEGIWAIITLIGHFAGVYLDDLHPTRGFGVFQVRINGGFEDADILGVLEGMVALIFFALLTARGNVGIQKRYLVAGGSIAVAASALAFSRTGWLAAFSGVIVLLFMQRGKNIFNAKFMAMISVAVVLLAFFMSLPVMEDLTGGLPSSLGDRFGQIFDISHGSGEGRANVQRGALRLWWQEQPLLGRGFSSLISHGEQRDPNEGSRWIPGTYVLALTSTGIVGLGLVLIIRIGTLLLLIRGYRKTTDAFYRASLAGFIAAYISIFVASLSYSLLWFLGVFWILSGLAVSVALIAPKADSMKTVPSR